MRCNVHVQVVAALTTKGGGAGGIVEQHKNGRWLVQYHATTSEPCQDEIPLVVLCKKFKAYA